MRTQTYPAKYPPALQLLKVADLAKILHKSEGTIRHDICRNPDGLPPRLELPGSHRILWRLETVLEWLDKHDTKHKTAETK